MTAVRRKLLQAPARPGEQTALPLTLQHANPGHLRCPWKRRCSDLRRLKRYVESPDLVQYASIKVCLLALRTPLRFHNENNAAILEFTLNEQLKNQRNPPCTLKNQLKKHNSFSAPFIIDILFNFMTNPVFFCHFIITSVSTYQELHQENTVLKEQVQQQMLQISGLRNQLDQLRNYGGEEADDDVTQLRARLQTERDALERSEVQVRQSLKLYVLIAYKWLSASGP